MGFGSSSEFSGVRRPTRLSPFLAASSRSRIGTASPGVLRPFDVCASWCPSPRNRRYPASAGARIATPSLGAALGLSRPSAVSATHRRRTPVARDPTSGRLALETPRPCFMPRTPLGFALQSFPFSTSRAAFRRPLLPCGFVTRLDTDATRPRISRSVSPAFRHLAARLGPVKARHARRRSRERELPRPSRSSVHRAVARTTTATTAPPRRARRHAARSPASKLCSRRESVHSRTDHAGFRRFPSLRPRS